APATFRQERGSGSPGRGAGRLGSRVAVVQRGVEGIAARRFSPPEPRGRGPAGLVPLPFSAASGRRTGAPRERQPEAPGPSNGSAAAGRPRILSARPREGAIRRDPRLAG